MRDQKGFTLLELIIVIGLIAVAAAIAMVALNDARDKGRDTGVKANLSQIRQHAESVHLEDGHYNRVCGVNGDQQETTITQLVTAAEIESPGEVGSATCGATAAGDSSGWAISVALATEGYWCVDAAGFSGYSETGLDHSNDVSCQ